MNTVGDCTIAAADIGFEYLFAAASENLVFFPAGQSFCSSVETGNLPVFIDGKYSLGDTVQGKTTGCQRLGEVSKTNNRTNSGTITVRKGDNS